MLGLYIYMVPPQSLQIPVKFQKIWTFGGGYRIYIYMYVLLGPTDLTFKQLFHTLSFFRRCFSRAAVVAVSLSTTP